MFGDFGDEFDVSELAVRAVADQYTGRGPSTMLSRDAVRAPGRGVGGRDARSSSAGEDPRMRSPEVLDH